MKPATAFCRILIFLCTLCYAAEAHARSSNSPSLLDAYSQGERDNCGSVALTKLILAKYGIAPASGPFARQGDANGGGFSMALVDGTTVKVSGKQLSMATDQSGFEADPENALLDAANALYAVMAVRRAGQNDGAEVSTRTFRRALKTLGHGGDAADADVLPALLGFAGFAEPVPPQQAFATYLIGSGHHIGFVQGQFYDKYGRAGGTPVDAFNPEFGTPTMYRYAFDPDGDQIFRQCSNGGLAWTPHTAIWRSCTSTEVINLDRR